MRLSLLCLRASAILIIFFAPFAVAQEAQRFDRMIESVIAPSLLDKNRSEAIQLPSDVRQNLNLLREEADMRISQMGDIVYSILGSKAPVASAEEYTYY